MEQIHPLCADLYMSLSLQALIRKSVSMCPCSDAFTIIYIYINIYLTSLIFIPSSGLHRNYKEFLILKSCLPQKPIILCFRLDCT